MKVARSVVASSSERAQATQLDFRYVQLHTDGSTASGHCTTDLELLADGRVRLNETWAWESRPGSGRSVEVELG
jgi:hypothetical protein